MLLLRKLLLVCISELTGRNAMFQASLSLSVIALSYGLHAKYHPFVTTAAQAKAVAEFAPPVPAGPRSGLSSSRLSTSDASDARTQRLSKRLGRRDSEVKLELELRNLQQTLQKMVHAGAAAVLLDFNVLETTLLACSMAVLLGGMVFQSSQLSPGGVAYIVLTMPSSSGVCCSSRGWWGSRRGERAAAKTRIMQRRRRQRGPRMWRRKRDPPDHHGVVVGPPAPPALTPSSA